MTMNIPMGDDEFEEKPYEVTGRIITCIPGQTDYSDGGKSTEHKKDCVFDSEEKAGERWSCGQNSGCTETERYYLQWDIERDDGRTNGFIGEEKATTWLQNDTINNSERGRYNQQRHAVNAALESRGKPMMSNDTSSDVWNKWLSDTRATFESVIPKSGGRAWLKFKDFE